MISVLTLENSTLWTRLDPKSWISSSWCNQSQPKDFLTDSLYSFKLQNCINTQHMRRDHPCSILSRFTLALNFRPNLSERHQTGEDGHAFVKPLMKSLLQCLRTQKPVYFVCVCVYVFFLKKWRFNQWKDLWSKLIHDLIWQLVGKTFWASRQLQELATRKSRKNSRRSSNWQWHVLNLVDGEFRIHLDGFSRCFELQFTGNSILYC